MIMTLLLFFFFFFVFVRNHHFINIQIHVFSCKTFPVDLAHHKNESEELSAPNLRTEKCM